MFILGKDYNRLDINLLRDLIVVINTAKLSEHYKNNIKSDLKNFLKYKYPDWSSRFSGLDDIKTNNGMNQERINSKTLFSKGDIEKLMAHEPKMFWKSLLITQYEGGLRTKEVRFLKWEDIKFNVDGDLSEISIFATKTKQARTIFVKEATFYLKKLREEQNNLNKRGVYVFSLNNEPIDKFNVSKWFRGLTRKALGRIGWNYLLRHSRATELYTLALQNKISKDIAAKFMGHSEDMSEIYLHLDQKSIQEMTRNQVYNLREELPKDKMQEFEEMKKRIAILENPDKMVEILFTKLKQKSASSKTAKILMKGIEN